MSSPHLGRHEHGQNFLHDQRVVDAIVDLVARTDGPIVEIGAGAGALTVPLQRLGRPLTAIEVDGRRAARLADRTAASTRVVAADFLRFRLPRTPHVIVGNLPFHLTTAMMRRVLHAPCWTDAVLLVQWEVARRRAGIGGATMMTAQWWPWFEFALSQRISAAAFRPRPSVDGGLMTIRRRDAPLVADDDRRRYQAMVHQVFTGRGHGIGQILSRTLPPVTTRHWLRHNGVRAAALPRDLTAAQWAALFRAYRSTSRD
ncbi:MAG TPA: 23S ribosomal RNA methyltransferase Erm [Mycobacterium sp.]|nr:23S ribosomal RNA methyltransferase Erm [Mycobacterium sp.]